MIQELEAIMQGAIPLSGNEYKLSVGLLSVKGNNCTAATDAVAHTLKMSKNTVVAVRRSLQQKGLLRIERDPWSGNVCVWNFDPLLQAGQEALETYRATSETYSATS